MARHIPYVSDGVLHLREPWEGSTVAVGSASWIAWLADPATRSFSFRSPRGAYTARKERRTRGGEYWTAYRRHSGRLRKTYLGKADLVFGKCRGGHIAHLIPPSSLRSGIPLSALSLASPSIPALAIPKGSWWAESIRQRSRSAARSAWGSLSMSSTLPSFRHSRRG